MWEETGDEVEVVTGGEDDGIADHQADQSRSHLHTPVDVGHGAEVMVARLNLGRVLQGMAHHAQERIVQPDRSDEIVLVQTVVGVLIVQDKPSLLEEVNHDGKFHPVQEVGRKGLVEDFPDGNFLQNSWLPPLGKHGLLLLQHRNHFQIGGWVLAVHLDLPIHHHVGGNVVDLLLDFGLVLGRLLGRQHHEAVVVERGVHGRGEERAQPLCECLEVGFQQALIAFRYHGDDEDVGSRRVQYQAVQVDLDLLSYVCHRRVPHKDVEGTRGEEARVDGVALVGAAQEPSVEEELGTGEERPVRPLESLELWQLISVREVRLQARQYGRLDSVRVAQEHQLDVRRHLADSCLRLEDALDIPPKDTPTSWQVADVDVAGIEVDQVIQVLHLRRQAGDGGGADVQRGERADAADALGYGREAVLAEVQDLDAGVLDALRQCGKEVLRQVQ